MLLKRHMFAGFVALLVIAMTGCGPILSTSRVESAEDALEKAEQAGAKEKAPYEYTLAREYLRKASELWGHSKFGDSATYAKRSSEFSEAALEKAQNDPWVNPLAGVTE